MESRQDYKKSHIKSFVVRGGRLSKGQQAAYDTLMGTYSIELTAGTIDLTRAFGNSGDVILEIGFGSGSATAEIAERNQDINYLGIEVYKPGIGNLLKLIDEKGLSNIRIIEGDAYSAVERCIGPESLAGIHLFFPDPWPKKKHHKRRIVRPEFCMLLHRVLKPGGYIYFVTDWEEYAERALEILGKTPGFKNRYTGFAPPQSWRPVTRFHRKGLEQQHSVREIIIEKV